MQVWGRHHSSGPYKQQESVPARGLRVEQHLGRARDDSGRLVCNVLGQLEVAGVDRVPDRGEIGLVVAGPELWPVDNMDELSPIGYLVAG